MLNYKYCIEHYFPKSFLDSILPVSWRLFVLRSVYGHHIVLVGKIEQIKLGRCIGYLLQLSLQIGNLKTVREGGGGGGVGGLESGLAVSTSIIYLIVVARNKAYHIFILPLFVFSICTVMYPAYAKWIKSHRDLPLKLNQWNNVVVCRRTCL